MQRKIRGHEAMIHKKKQAVNSGRHDSEVPTGSNNQDVRSRKTTIADYHRYLSQAFLLCSVETARKAYTIKREPGSNLEIGCCEKTYSGLF